MKRSTKLFILKCIFSIMLTAAVLLAVYGIEEKNSILRCVGIGATCGFLVSLIMSDWG